MPAVPAGQQPTLEQPGEQADPEPAGQVVVAGAGLPQGAGVGALAQRADRLRRGDPGKRLQGLGDRGRREPVEPGSALGPHRDQPRRQQPGQMLTDRGRRDPGLRGEAAGRQGPPVGQRGQDPGPGRVADQRPDRGDIRVALHRLLSTHICTLATEHFGRGPNDLAGRLRRMDTSLRRSPDPASPDPSSPARQPGPATSVPASGTPATSASAAALRGCRCWPSRSAISWSSSTPPR